MRTFLVVILVLSTGSSWGASWREINKGLPSSVAGAGGLAIDPTNPSTLYSWTHYPGNRGLFKSTDGGVSWTPISGVSDVSWLVVDRKNSATLYAGASYGVVMSVNGGASWTTLSTEPVSRWLSSVVIDPQDSNTLYAISGGVIKSTDGGASWKPSHTGLPAPPYPRFLTIDPVTPSTLYVTVENGGIFKSTDRGESWFALKAGAPNIGGGNLSLAIDPVTPSTIYAGSFAAATGPGPGGARPNGGQGTISKSTDGGRTWSIIRAGVPPDARVDSFVIDPASPSLVYASFEGRGRGVLKSTDGGETWNVLTTGIPAGNFAVSMVMDPQASSTLYVGYVDRSDVGVGGVLKSTDGGASWSPVNAGRNFVDVRTLAVDPVDAGVLYAAAGTDGVFKSVAGGENWTRLAALQLPAWPATANSPPMQAGPASARSLVINFARPNILYALTVRVNGCHPMDRLLFKSTDGGATWSDASPPLSGCNFWNFGQAVPMVIDPTHPDTLYVGADFGDINGENPALLKTTDGGASWSDPLNWGCCAASALAVDPENPATLYGGTWSGVLKSIDGGATWSDAGNLRIGVNVLALDPGNPSILYAATDTGYGSFGGLFKSMDNGASWFAINNGLDRLIDTRAPVTALVVDPVRPQTLYAGTLAYGVFRSTDGGANWIPFNDGLTNLDIRLLALAPGGVSTLYAGTGSGVFAVNVAPERIRPARSRR